VLAFDPEGETTQLLRALGVAAELWDGELAPGRTLVIGRHALDGTATLPGSLREFVRTGGRAVVFAQDPDWLRRAMGFRVARHVSRRCFPLAAPSAHPVVAGLDAEDFRDWNGAGTLVPETWGGLEDDPDRDPRYGWHWGNPGSVSSGAIEKPHHSGWRPILDAEFDLAYSPLMELRYGQGVALLCTLDLEARTGGDPVAERLAERIVTYAREAPLTPSRRQTVLLGGERGAGLLRESGLEFATSDRLPDPSALAVIGPEAAVADEALRSFLERGGHALLLPRPAGALPLGLRAAPTRTCGSLEVPAWPECEGLSASDLRLRAEIEAPLIAEAPVGEIGAGGMLARVPVGPGVAVFAQVGPELLATEERTYLRYSAWRVTRALTQLLANLGATFEMDAKSLDIGWHLAELPVPLAGEWRCKVEQTLPLAETPEGRHADPGVSPEAAGWAAADLDDSAWETHRLPGYFESWGPEWRMDGAVWFRRQVVLPAEWAGQSLTLRLGPVDDTDATYFNGELVGTNSGWNVSRTYRIPPALVRPGLNTIAVRAFDSYGGGGFAGPSEDLRLELPAPPPPAGLQMVKNADFARGLDAWTLGVFGDATAEALVVEDAPQPLVGARSVQLDVTATSAEGWHVMLLQTGLGVEQGRSYDLSFWAKADHPTQVSAQVTMNHPPHHPVGPTLTADLGTGWQEYRFAWRPDQSDDDVRLTLLGMCDETGRYQFAGLSLTAQELEASEEVAARPLGFYSRDYREDFELGDDPYRYYRW
jgi:beta-galactosidase